MKEKTESDIVRDRDGELLSLPIDKDLSWKMGREKQEKYRCTRENRGGKHKL